MYTFDLSQISIFTTILFNEIVIFTTILFIVFERICLYSKWRF